MTELRVLIAGAGGHGMVVADILLAAHRADAGVRPIGFVDDDDSLSGTSILGLPVRGAITASMSVPHDAMVVAIGDNSIRRKIYLHLQELGEQFVVAQHPAATLAAATLLGPGTVACAGVVVNAGATIGRNGILNTGCIVEHHCTIADHVHVAPGARLGGEVSVGEDTLVGIGAILLPGIRVGRACVIGGGAVVTADVADESVVAGVPARFVRSTSAGETPA